ncbi:MAG: HD domain-containing protein [Bdellovibrio sp.]|nr:HD domain-containing protein [Bdellovibrio sp.]
MFEKKQFVKEIQEKDPVASPFLVKLSAVATDKNGKPYLNLIFMDKTGEIEAKVWEDIPAHMGQVVKGAFVYVEGKCKTYQGRKQVQISKMQILREDEVDISLYLPESPCNVESLYAQLVQFINAMQDPHYRALAKAVFIDDEEIVLKLKKAPAAKSVHHAYPGGLLEHVISVTKALDFFSKLYAPYLDRDLLFLGGFLHDIGKLWELSYDRVTDYSFEGKLVGHLVMGVELVERKINELEKKENGLPGALPGAFPAEKRIFVFPKEKKILVKHMILSHHGELEFGSPKRPKCLEALVVHSVDNLDSKVNTIRTFIEQDQTPGRWTGLNKSFERYFYKPDWVYASKD